MFVYNSYPIFQITHKLLNNPPEAKNNMHIFLVQCTYVKAREI